MKSWSLNNHGHSQYRFWDWASAGCSELVEWVFRFYKNLSAGCPPWIPLVQIPRLLLRGLCRLPAKGLGTQGYSLFLPSHGGHPRTWGNYTPLCLLLFCGWSDPSQNTLPSVHSCPHFQETANPPWSLDHGWTSLLRGFSLWGVSSLPKIRPIIVENKVKFLPKCQQTREEALCLKFFFWMSLNSSPFSVGSFPQS